MKDSRSVARPRKKPTLGLEDSLPASRERQGALAICAVLVVTAGLAALVGQGAGPELRSFVPIAATVWSLADILTGFLLVVQFYVNGNVLFAVLATAYAFSGFMTWAYLAAFPGVFRAASLTLGDQQLPVYMWTFRHWAFPALVMFAMLRGAGRRVESRHAIHVATPFIVAAPIVAAAAVSTLAYVFRDALPHLVLGGKLAPLWTSVFVPSVIALNAVGCIVLLKRRPRLTALSLWLTVAMFSTILDALLNLNTTRYSYAWDTGKLITVFTASVVLIMIMCDVVGLYGQLAQAAMVDVLTSLPNRRAFEERFAVVLQNGRRQRGSIALLVVDVDFFAKYNATYGRIAGDGCLQRIAWQLAECATRPLDLVARYSPEKFVVALPDTPLAGVRIIAERVRAAVEDVEIVNENRVVGRLTVSIGVGFTADAQTVDEAGLFAAAERALYDAKAGGRNRVEVTTIETVAGKEPILPFLSAVGAGSAGG